MVYKLSIEKDGITGFWYVLSDTVTEAIIKTLYLGVNVTGWRIE